MPAEPDYKFVLTNSENKDFIDLVTLLDKDLKIRDGDDHEFYHQFNNIDVIKHTIVLYYKAKAIGCGALKEYDSKTMEVKRMYILEDHRNKGLASKILLKIELWSKELGYTNCILETGYNQPEAIRLYKKNLYRIIPNYGQYQDVKSSICFKKVL